MARRKQPTRLKVLAGNPGKRRLPEGEPEPPQIMPEPPCHLTEYAREEWDRLAKGLFDLKLLSELDMAAFAAYCSAYALWRKAEEKLAEERLTVPSASRFHVTTNPLVRIASNARLDMIKCAVEFGLTPRARASLGFDPRKTQRTGFEGLIGRSK